MTNLDYALTMLEIYQENEPLNFEAIAHYRQLAEDEREKLERDRIINIIISLGG